MTRPKNVEKKGNEEKKITNERSHRDVHLWMPWLGRRTKVQNQTKALALPVSDCVLITAELTSQCFWTILYNSPKLVSTPGILYLKCTMNVLSSRGQCVHEYVQCTNVLYSEREPSTYLYYYLLHYCHKNLIPSTKKGNSYAARLRLGGLY